MNSLEIGRQVQIPAGVQSMRDVVIPESVRTLQSGVMFWNEPNHHHKQQSREEALAVLAGRVGSSVENLGQLSWEGINLIDVLITVGNTEAAQHLANQPDDISKVPYQLLVDTAAGLKRTARNKGQYVPDEQITVDRKQLEQSLSRLDQDTDLWIKQWTHCLETLDLSSSGIRKTAGHLRSETVARWGAGDMASGHWSP